MRPTERNVCHVMLHTLDYVKHLEAVMDGFLGVIIQQQGTGLNGQGFIKSQSVLV